jgi:hypothetical protein
MLEGERDYSNLPTLPKLCDLAEKLIEFGINLIIDELRKTLTSSKIHRQQQTYQGRGQL